MSYEDIATFIGLIFLFLSNLVFFVVFVSRLSSRIGSIEDKIKLLEAVDKLHSDELKTLHKIEGQLELLIKHIIPTK